MIDEAHAAVLRALKDPDSAKFEDRLTHAFPKRGLVCGGQVNSKNSFGGYTGSQAYYYKQGEGAFLDEDSAAIPVIEACTAALSESAAAVRAEAERLSGKS
ncbi:hypothetical protein [Novosphingobium sp. ST904]|uniref:hypothetical protein n=1 Tax=Novosphingobium sp. ST904 TaxID=1684385 RepID=UPI00104B427F|nr:hypothetical protein [Novosphingobium sp. ST904]